VAPTTLSTCVALALFALTPATFAQDLRLNQREVHAITDAVRTMFEGVRDGDVAKITAVIPTRAEFASLYQPGAQPFLERHLRAIERDTRELRAVFAGATFVGLDSSFAAGRSLRLERCGRFGARASQCANGPIIEYRVGSVTRHFRVDRIVRLPSGVWKIYDVRL
jgi:hypothetical protein